MGLFKIFTLPVHTDDRFSLIPLEVEGQIDFPIKRVYAITNALRPTGQHAHKIEQECFICFQGEVTAEIDDGSGRREVKLQPGDAIYVGTYVWHHFKDFSPGCVLVALSSTNYNPERFDYIVDYEEFKKTTTDN
ncbi:MAG: FdtA/QdtA family cupin domain-containing protein [Candidatus Kerfeldbacteria bacterium]|nr:FdtA/QdtA family cupin domain-containing protein [Candidatus Kerfeldbacteria bacterium]